jgi:hypothetical protein
MGRKTTGLRPKGYDRRVAEGRLKKRLSVQTSRGVFCLKESEGERDHKKES